MTTPARLRQHVRYVTAADGTRLAWAESGAGPMVAKAANWLTHLEYEWDSPVWRHWIQFFSTTGAIFAELFDARAVVDISASLGLIRAPTLVLHARNDEVVPVAEGRILASGIPGAEFVELDSRNHILLEHEPAWQRFQEAVLAFQESGDARTDSVFAALSTRERQVLALMADGLSNADIAARLEISEKTVRNHASNLFDKLGVWSRAQAIVFAHDHGFRG